MSAAISPPKQPVHMLVIGCISAGRPVLGSEVQQGCITIDLGGVRLPRQGATTFALIVKGSSMIGAGIRDGDIAMFEHRSPRSGDVVAALIDGESTLKRYVEERGKPFLKAENPRFPSLVPAQELVIQGVLVALLRNFP